MTAETMPLPNAVNIDDENIEKPENINENANMKNAFLFNSKSSASYPT